MVSCTQSYDALGLPATRTAEDGTVTTVTGDYDYMGRRIFKKVETTVTDPETGESTTSVILNHRYLYRGYLQIAALDLTRTTLNALWYILWDPTEPVATRPLAIQTAGSWFVYGWDLTKNVMELYKSNGTIANSYSYAPFGEVTQRGNITNPLQWSSEAYDAELSMVYYNFRFYNPFDGRWLRRDPHIELNSNLYAYVYNTPTMLLDIRGEWAFALPIISIPVSLIVAGAIVATVVITEVVRPGTIKEIVDEVIPKTKPIPIPVPNIKKTCPPCPPPQQSGSRVDCVPPSRKHYPCPGTHKHTWHYVMDQNPITCECYERKVEHPVECL